MSTLPQFDPAMISIEEWRRQNHAGLMQRLSLETQRGVGPSDWYLEKVRD